MLSEWKKELVFCGDLAKDVPHFLSYHGYSHTATHCGAVACEAVRLAWLFGMDAQLAAQAGWLHDVSVIFPEKERVALAESWGVEVLPEELALPMILHQKLSVICAREIFALYHPEVLSSIECHTTLRRDASALDKLLFVADKLAWDQSGQPPYYDRLLAGLASSLDEGVRVYLRYLWAQGENLPVLHPWFVAAYQQLCAA